MDSAAVSLPHSLCPSIHGYVFANEQTFSSHLSLFTQALLELLRNVHAFAAQFSHNPFITTYVMLLGQICLEAKKTVAKPSSLNLPTHAGLTSLSHTQSVRPSENEPCLQLPVTSHHRHQQLMLMFMLRPEAAAASRFYLANLQ